MFPHVQLQARKLFAISCKYAYIKDMACATKNPESCSIPSTQPIIPRDNAWYVDQARILSALSNPARLRMVVALSQGEKCVCEMAAEVGLDQSTTSRHLVQLRQAGLLSDERRGNMVFYHLKATCLPSFLDCLNGLAGRT
ncbi:MAG TPA: metalloregulator ArsR/SmtB family transcription factor [Fibrobacteria bacterium]|nr:metalloregulator ArsR/SmtB family transcription factor [Fibrobacteria bacterium]